MKRIVSVMLILLITLSMVACSEKKIADNVINEEKIEAKIDNTEETKLTEVEVLPEVSEAPVSETVWANTSVNVRSGPGLEFGIIGNLNYTLSTTRTAVVSNGWSKIAWGDGYGYAKSEYLSTTEIISPSIANNTNLYCTGLAKEIFDATNAQRISAGLDPLIWSDELALAAQVRANEIITNFSHIRPDGTKCYALNSSITGENLIRGPSASGQEMVSRWMTSDGHRTNILWKQHRVIGIATVTTSQGTTGCQLFGY